MSRKTNREYESEVLVGRDIAPTPRECEELPAHSNEPMRVDWCVSSWFRINNTHSHADEAQRAIAHWCGVARPRGTAGGC